MLSNETKYSNEYILSYKSIRTHQMNQMIHFKYYTRLLKMGKIFIGILKIFGVGRNVYAEGEYFMLMYTSNFARNFEFRNYIPYNINYGEFLTLLFCFFSARLLVNKIIIN